MVENWLAPDGIPENSVLSLAQTPDGYIWVGTQDGLLRFNGVQFAQVAPESGLDRLAGIIVTLSIDLRGRLWAGAEQSIAYLDHGTWHPVVGTNLIYGPNFKVRSFAEGTGGIMYCGSFDGHVYTAKDDLLQPMAMQPPGTTNSGVFCIRDVKDGGLWLANRGFVGRWDGTAWKRFDSFNGAAPPLIAAAARSGGIWVLAGRALQHYQADGSIISNAVPLVYDFRQMAEDPSGTVWVASVASGVTRLIPNGTNWVSKTLTATNGLVQNPAWALLFDKEGNDWVGSASGGLQRLSKRQFINIGQQQGLPDNLVRTVVETSPGNILVGTHGGGLAVITNDRVTSVRRAEQGVSGRYGWSLLKDKSGRLWIGTYLGGLFVEENGVERSVELPPALGLVVNSLMEDSRGRIWVGAQGGVGFIETNVFHELPPETARFIDNASCMADDPQARAVWIGTSDHGLFKLVDGKHENPERVAGLPTDRITCLKVGKDGCIWAGVYNNGLAAIENGKTILFGHDQGLPALIVASMIDDGRGFYWMGTDQGIIRAAQDELLKVRRGIESIATFSLFNQRDGIGWGNCGDGNQPSVLQASDKRLWFATLNGVVVADPTRIQLNTNPPPLLMERVAYLDRAGQPQEMAGPFDRQFEIPPGSSEVELHFAVLSFTSPEKMRIYYNLQKTRGYGFFERQPANTNWLDLGNHRELLFHSPMTPGPYRLQIKARNNDGVWNQTGLILQFSVAPFFWQTAWFRVIGGAGMLAVGGLAAWQLARLRFQRRIALLENERALEHEKARLASIMEATSDLVAFADSEGRLLHVNAAGRKLLGYGANENLSKSNLTSFFPEWAAERLTNEAVPAARQHGTWEGETALLGKNGREIPVSQVMIAHKNPEGQISFLSTVARDITERRQSEREKDRLLEELLQSRKLESVGRLAGGIAHDFNNMMQVVLGNASLALEICPRGGELEGHLKEIESSANHSADLTRRLLAFARKQKVQPQVLDLNETVGGMLKVLRRLIGENISLSWKPGQKLWPVTMDPLQIDQIITNLVVNGRDAIAGGGFISIETSNMVMAENSIGAYADRVPGEFVVLSVRDTGKGMTPDVVEHIFEPFFTTKGVGEGTGLGLATVFGIVKQNHGWIEVETMPDKGSTFQVFLPRSHTAPAPAAPSQRAEAALPAGRETILVVEDEPSILELSAFILQRCGYTVLSAEHPEKALRIASSEKHHIDLLLTDVIMPGMSGKEMWDKLKAMRPSLKCIFMSGYDKNIFGAAGVRDSGVPFLQKPFTHRQLVNLVREQLDRKSS